MKLHKILAIASTFLSTGGGFADPFPFEPPRQMYLLPKMDTLFHPVDTENNEAQQFFSQGLTFKYGGNCDAAYWSFLRAAELDPNLAMAYWGMALALATDLNFPLTPENREAGRKSIEQAKHLENRATDIAKEYINALAQLYGTEGDAAGTDFRQAYKNSMKALTRHYPDDLDAATLYAQSIMLLDPNNYWQVDGSPTGEIIEAIDVLESVLKREPTHIGANSYYIQIVQASKHPTWGLPSARKLKDNPPAIGHLLHVPSMVYLRVGDFAQAAKANEQAITADQEYIRQFGNVGNYPIFSLCHSYHSLARAYTLEGRGSDALKAAIDLQQFYVPLFERVPTLQAFATLPQWVLLRFNRFEEVIRLKPFPEELTVANVMLDFAKAYSFTSLEMWDEAEKARSAYLTGKEGLDLKTKFGANRLTLIFQLAEKQLEAKIAFIKGEIPKAVENLKNGIAMQDLLRHGVPPDWYSSMRQNLGAVLFQQRLFAEAERQFRDDLKVLPRNGRSLFGLLESLKAQNKDKDAAWVENLYLQAWKNSTEPPLKMSDLF